MRTISYRETDSLGLAEAPRRGSSKARSLQYAMEPALIQKALKQVDGLNLKQDTVKRQGPKPTDLAANIEALKSADVDVRRNARLQLAKGGAANVSPLLAALRADADNYRLKIGITFSLSKMSDAVSITKAEDASLLVRLAGDDDADVRQYASEFLMRLSDHESIKAVLPELQAAIDRERNAPVANGNAVYNSVVILGTWMRTLPGSLSPEKAAIANYLKDLQPKLTAKANWDKTQALIKELNAAPLNN